MRFARIFEALRFLRIQLAAWNAGVFLLINLVMLVIVHEGVQQSLIVENDLRLLDDAKEFSRTVEAAYPDLDRFHGVMNRKARTHGPEGLFMQLLDAPGHVVWSSVNTPNLKVLYDPALAQAEHASVGQYRLAHHRLDHPDLSHYTVRVGASMRLVEQAVNQRTRLMTIVGLVIAIITVVVAYWLAGRATQPLARIVQTAARLRPTRLDERLPIRGTGDELDQLSQTINHLLDRIGEYLARNRDFVANAAHELRSPLAAIQSSVDVSLNVDRTTDEYKNLLYDVVDECARLSTLVNQLLLLAESDGGAPLAPRERVRLDRIVEKSVDMFRGFAEDRGVEISTKFIGNSTLFGDADRLRQVVNNLLDNAVKFTPAGGRVALEVSFDPHSERVELRVSDTGSGIEPEDVPHLFERFYRGDKSRYHATSEWGHGLGLSICESIVKSHGGQMSIASQLGQGTVVSVTLPAASSQVHATSC